MIHHLFRATRLAFDTAFPPVCPGCQKPTQNQHSLCGTCFGRCDFITHPVTKQGIPVPHAWMLEDDTERLGSCDLVRSAMIYDDFSSQIIHGFKYLDRLERAPLLAKFLYQAGREFLAESHIIVPVPMHPWRLWLRRYNQSCVLAHALRKICRKEGYDSAVNHRVLRMSFSDTTQASLNRKKRFENVNSLLSIDRSASKYIYNRNVIILDDVITTGSTVESCALLLKRAGAGRVYALSVLRVLRGATFPAPMEEGEAVE